ncbi:MAG: DUF4394 domain-containing protein [Pedobacter sp.]|nr:MAG: DUF4394 domain-containing protein [Pedobacter sp.]
MKTLKLFSLKGLTLIFALLLTFTACKKDRNVDENLAPAPDISFLVLTQDNKLTLVNPRTNQSGNQITVSGLQSGENLMAIDFRPATGQLYAIGSTSRIYVIDLNTGSARMIGAGAFTPALTGTAVAFDFNPTVDRIRVVTSAGQNLRIHPETGAVAFTDGPISADNQVTSVAYTNSFAGATSTVLFDIDVKNNKLYKQDPPNAGTLVEVGNLNVDAEEIGGFDIASDNSVAVAALSVAGRSSLYTIDLNTGNAARVGNFEAKVTGIAIPSPAVSYVIGANNEFIIYNPNLATNNTITKVITGMQPGENILGIDTRPVNGQLYILGSTSRIYTLNSATAEATAVGTTPFTTLLSGTSFGFDFNPTVDRIRIVSNTGQNLRVHPETGVVAFVDGVLNPGTPSITAAAYTNNFAGAATTVLFDIDSETNMLYKQDPPNDGKLTAVGPLGVDVTAANGFDIGGTSGLGYAILSTSTTTRLYSINLSTGAATAIKDFSMNVKGFTLGLGF